MITSRWSRVIQIRGGGLFWAFDPPPCRLVVCGGGGVLLLGCGLGHGWNVGVEGLCVVLLVQG